MLVAIAMVISTGAIVPDSSQTNNAPKTNDTRSVELLQRLEEIKSMDKSDLTRVEKRNLRKEVKDIRKEMKATSGGVYLSVGAIIIIILLLILIL
jgi:hypothetical protein